MISNYSYTGVRDPRQTLVEGLKVYVYSSLSGITYLSTLNADGISTITNGFHDVDIYGTTFSIYFSNEGSSEMQLVLAAVHIYSQRHLNASKMVIFTNNQVQEIYPQDSENGSCDLAYGYSSY